MSDLSTAPPVTPPPGTPPPLTPPPVTGEADAPHWTARHGKPIIFVILTMVAVGAYLALTIPVAVFPDTNFPRIIVGADNGVFPIDQMLVTTTKPLEEALNTVQGLDHLWSVTSRGTAEIDLFFNWNVDMYRTLELVNAQIARVQATLPAGAKITANRLTFAAFPIMGFSLYSDKIPQTTLWEMATYELKPRLNRQTGVSTVVVQGGQVPEFQVQPDPAKMVQAGVTVPNILDAITRSNMIDSPGLIEANHQLILSLVSGQTRTPEEISNIVIKTTPAGAPVRIGDIGTVGPSVMPVYTRVTANGKPSILFNVYRQPDSNTVVVAQAVRDEADRIRKELPSGVELKPFYDQSELVTESIQSVRDAIVLGLVLACLIMVVFLRDWGTSLVAGLVIPATIGITFIMLRALNQSFNLMTLGGLAAAVGLVIDDAIVVVENIVMHRDSGQSRAEAIRSAIREIRVPLVGSTITPIVVLLPLISMVGVYGVFFRALAVTVGIALLTSLALALTWTPTLSHFLLRSKRAGAANHEEPNGPVMRFLVGIYERVIRVTLEHKLVLAVFCLLLVGGSYLCYTHTGSDVLPEMDEGGFICDYIMPAGSSLEETDRVITHVDKILHGIPEVENTSRRTGMQLGLATVTEANTGDLTIKLKHGRKRGGPEVIADARARIHKAEPVLDTEFPQFLQDNINDLTSNPEPVVIKLFSQDPELLARWAPLVGSTIKGIPGVVDVLNGIENTISGPARVFTVDQVTTARSGFTPQEVELDASAILQGEPASAPVVVNDRAYTIRVRFPDQTRVSLDSIRDTMLVSGTGKTATIGSLANIVEIPGQTEIRRENLQRAINVTARFEGLNLGDGMKKIQAAIDDLKIPPSIRVQYGGQYEEQQKSFKDLAFVLVLAVVLVFMVLLFEFGNFAAPLAIVSSALLSTCGVLLALLITKTTFNLSSFMGLIMVIGIVAKNGILLLDADQKFRAEGMPAREAMIRAGERRLRPIMMTALATVAGMIPLALAFGAGSQMLQPLAIAVIGGIVASMVLSLVVTPAVHYYIAGRD
ncbi:MAG TPA: efflux RND transporter permease subunit [Candidatus Acidoferrales bacterium]|jgi:CzcA family heavy metal efflux pump|nr:efflux RND transporter permease subunit [Candidatus Acidoferrales bacterium]